MPAPPLSPIAEVLDEGTHANHIEREVTAPLLSPTTVVDSTAGPRSSTTSDDDIPLATRTRQRSPPAHSAQHRPYSESDIPTGLRITSFASATNTDISDTESSEGHRDMKRQLRATIAFPIPFGGNPPVFSKPVEAKHDSSEQVELRSLPSSCAVVEESQDEQGLRPSRHPSQASRSSLESCGADENSESGSGEATPRASVF